MAGVMLRMSSQLLNLSVLTGQMKDEGQRSTRTHAGRTPLLFVPVPSAQKLTFSSAWVFPVDWFVMSQTTVFDFRKLFFELVRTGLAASPNTEINPNLRVSPVDTS